MKNNPEPKHDHHDPHTLGPEVDYFECEALLPGDPRIEKRERRGRPQKAANEQKQPPDSEQDNK